MGGLYPNWLIIGCIFIFVVVYRIMSLELGFQVRERLINGCLRYLES